MLPTDQPTPLTSEPSSLEAQTPDRDLSKPVVMPYRWHLFLCADQTKPKCCEKSVGLEAWDYLKQRLKTLGLEQGDHRVYRTKANCLRLCDASIPGPILLIYPGGYWYRSATPDVIEQILQQHVIGGNPVTEYLVAEATLLAMSEHQGKV